MCKKRLALRFNEELNGFHKQCDIHKKKHAIDLLFQNFILTIYILIRDQKTEDIFFMLI